MAKETKILTKQILAVGDSRKHFRDLVLGLREEFKPDGFYQFILVDKLAIDYWRLKKLLLYEKEQIFKEYGLNNLIGSGEATQFISYQKSIEKSIENGIKALKNYKNERQFALV